MAITLIGHQPIDFTYKENYPCENLSSMCLQYETTDIPMFQLKNEGTTAPLVTIIGIGETDFDQKSLTPSSIDSAFYTYSLDFSALGITEGCFEICVYEIATTGQNLVTNGTFNDDLDGWTVADALVLSISDYTTPVDESSEDGELTLSATGGTAPYEYSMDGITYQVSDTFTGLDYDIGYTFYVRDDNNVVDTVPFTFRECSQFADTYLQEANDVYLFEVKDCYLFDFQ